MTLSNRESILARAVLGAAVLAVLCAGLYMAFENVMTGTIARNISVRTVELSYNFTIEDIPPQAHEILAWIPLPLDNDHQQLHEYEVGAGVPHRVVYDKEYGNRFLLLYVGDPDKTPPKTYTIPLKFTVTRYAIAPTLSTRTSEAAGINFDRHLKPDRLVPIDGHIKEEARQVVGDVTDPLQRARLLYDHIISTMTYDKSGDGWGRGDALYACDIRKGNCTDFHSLFIGQARSLGIPARFIMGLPVPSGKKTGLIDSYHCWAEFFVQGKGWIPIDASEAQNFPARKENLYGALDANRIAFSIGRDIHIPAAAAEPANYAIYPHVEIDGQSHDGVQTTFFFRDRPTR